MASQFGSGLRREMFTIQSMPNWSNAHAELVAPDLLGQWHRDGAADGELLEVLAQEGVVAGQGDREAGLPDTMWAGVSGTMSV